MPWRMRSTIGGALGLAIAAPAIALAPGIASATAASRLLGPALASGLGGAGHRQDGAHSGYCVLSSSAWGLMAEDGFVASVQRVADSGRIACESVEAAVHPLLRARQARLAGRPMSEIVDDLISAGGRDIRLGAAEAFRQFEREIQSMRGGEARRPWWGGRFFRGGGPRLCGVPPAGRPPASIARKETARLYLPPECE